MDDIKKRLQESTEACLKSYEAWDEEKSTESREALQESIHELRKVGSRLEIAIAINERETMSEKPLPIPSHRSNSKHRGAVESILPDLGNTEKKPSNGDKKSGGSRRPRTRRPEAKKSTE
jgi:hypothetical protein